MTDLDVPREGSRAIPPAADWAPVPAAPGWSVRPLLETQGFATRLMRVEPGAVPEAHAHDTVEQVYVIEGSLSGDDGAEHPAGSFIVRAAGTMHAVGSRDGATILVIYGDVGGDVG